MKLIFNKQSCHLRREVISRHVAQHRKITTQIQNKLANDKKVGLTQFHNEFNRLEKRHNLLIANITQHEATKTRNK